MEQFTFYELYADILHGLDEVSAGKFAKRICEYEFEDKEPDAQMTDKESFYWSNIADLLEEVKAKESTGKIPKKYNLRSKHFTFCDTYYKAMKLLNDRQCGVFVKAICEYMFNDIVPEFKDKSMQGYFNLCKRKMDLSKQRKTVGKVGGAVRKRKKKIQEVVIETVPIVAEQSKERTPIYTEQPQEKMTYDEFRKQYPEIQGELYGSSERYKSGLDWTDVANRREEDYDLQREQNIYRLTQKYIQKYRQNG